MVSNGANRSNGLLEIVQRRNKSVKPFTDWYRSSVDGSGPLLQELTMAVTPAPSLTPKS